MDDHDRYPPDAWKLLSPQLTTERRERMLAAVAERTGFVRLVMQDTHHPHNVSACLRSAEAFGLSDVDLVCHREKFSPSTVARGVAGWLRLNRRNSIAESVDWLKTSGFRLAAGVPPRSGVRTLDEIPLDQPIAVLFGNEKLGVADEWKPHLDFEFTIPMYGMVESLNISVSAAISLQALTARARKLLSPEIFHLDERGKVRLLNAWVCRQLRAWDKQLQHLRAATTTKSGLI